MGLCFPIILFAEKIQVKNELYPVAVYLLESHNAS